MATNETVRTNNIRFVGGYVVWARVISVRLVARLVENSVVRSMDVYGATSDAEAHPRTHGEQPGAGWDYAITIASRTRYDQPSIAADQLRQSLLARLVAAGFSYRQRWVPALHHVIIRFALPESVMMQRAQQLAVQLQTLPQFGGGFFAFSMDRAHIFENHLRRQQALPYFTAAQRVIITLAVLRSRQTWGSALDLATLLHTKKIKQAFALHTEPDRTALIRAAVYRQWWNPFHRTPLNALREYLGTRIAIYFAWLAFYTRMLLVLAAVSLLVQAILVYSTSQRLSAWTRLIFSLLLSYWSALGFDNWKRRNAVLMVQWGMARFYEAQENLIRPDFTGVPKKGFYCKGGFVDLQDLDPDVQHLTSRTSVQQDDTMSIITGQRRQRDVLIIGGKGDQDFIVEAAVTGRSFTDLPTFPVFDRKRHKMRINIAVAITAFFSLCVAAAAFSILFYKSHIIRAFGARSYARFVPGIATALLISIADPAWKQFSLRLTVWENHRTDLSFRNSLIRKRFAFQFVSNYISSFYVAFVKPFTPSDPCIITAASDQPDCMAELESLLTALVITKATLQQAIELGIPSLFFLIRSLIRRFKTSNLEDEITADQHLHLLSADAVIGEDDDDPALLESKKNKYMSTIDDYGELVVQYGLLVLFGLAFPLAALINLLNNLIECRTDAYKVLVIKQRPDADDAADIGGWLDVLKFLTRLSIITNTALVTVTSVSLQQALPNVIGDTAERYRGLSFFIFEHVLFMVRWIVASLVPDIPGSTYRLLARQDFLLAKCFGSGWKSYYGTDGADGSDLESIQDDPIRSRYT